MPILPIDTGRYGTAEMRKVFEEESRLQKILDVEAAVAYAHAQVGNVPKEVAEEIVEKANIQYVKLEKCKEIDKKINHDLMAVVKTLTEVCSPSASRWIHFGLTSADVEDTAYALQFKEAIKIIRLRLLELEKILIGLVEKYYSTLMVGRTHGQHVNVLTLGLKLAVWMREVSRHLRRLNQMEDRVVAGKIMGVIGTGSGLGKNAIEVQNIALKKLGLKSADMVTQVIQRDLHAELVSTLVLIGSSMDKFALEIRNLQRTEIMELMEPFKKDSQVGSSAMPAKRNPVKSERICSLAKLMRGLLIPAYENIALWHERDLTNSANERFIFSMSFILLDDMTNSMNKILSGLGVFPDNMKRNLALTGGLNLSENVVKTLVEKGMGRQEAHEIVRNCSMKSITKKIPFSTVLMEDEQISTLISQNEIKLVLDHSKYLGVTTKLIKRAIAITKSELENN